MKQTLSLEEKRQALLEQIHSSRDVYRRMLMDADAPEENRIVHAINHSDTGPVTGATGRFPQSMTMRWITQHPYLSALAVAAVVAIVAAGPRRVTQKVTNARVPRRIADAIADHPTIMTSLGAVTTMALRDPQKIRIAAKVFSVIAGFVQARRAKRSMGSRIQ